MKKITIVFILTLFTGLFTKAQTTLITEAPLTNGSTTQLRAPNGLSSSAYMQACALVLQNELAYIPSGSTLTVFGFTLQNTSSISTPVTGNFTLYLQNTTDASYLKGTTWSTIIAPMTQVYASVLTIPMSSGSTSVTISLSTPFVYNGGGLYVGYDWYCSGPYSTTNPATFWAESAALVTGCASGVSSTGAPTLGTSNFRPTFLLGFTNPYSNDARVSGIEAPGRIPATLNAPHNIRALVRNSSNVTLSNITVSANVSGANTFNNTQNIPSLAAGASTIVTFTAFNPQNAGTQTVVVSVPSDQFNANNSSTWVQEVTCNIWGLNPAVGQFTFNSVGFAAASGIIATQYTSAVTSTLIGLRGALSTNTPVTGNNLYGVLMNAAGAILATSNTVNVTAAMLGSFLNFNFSSPQTLAPNTTYYLGFAQTIPGNSIAYYPAGAMYQYYVPPSLYYVTALSGGAPSVLTQNFGYFGLEGVFAHTVTLSAPPQTVTCGSSATLNALSSTNYSWSTGATTSSIVISTATASAQFSVSATNSLGCTASAIASLIVAPIPVNATVNPAILCAGNTVTLTAGGASSFTWNTPAGQSNQVTINDTPLSNTAYTLIGSDPSGCSGNSIVNVVVNPLPNINIVFTSATVCLGNSVQLTAGGGVGSYTWSTGPVANSITVAPQTSTTFYATGVSAVGCAKTASASITVNSFTPQITLPPAICEGQSAQLSTTGASTLQWSNGSIFASITVTPAVTTVYSVTGKSTANGCQGSASATLIVNANPTVIAVASRTSICRNEKSVLTASGAVTYSWSNGTAGPSATVNPTSTLPLSMMVTGTNNLGCENTATVSVKVNACTGLDEFSNSDLILFPNPTSGIVKINSNDVSGRFTVVNTAGQLILSETAKGTSEIDLSAQPRGIYLLRWENEEGATRIYRLVRD